MLSAHNRRRSDRLNYSDPSFPCKTGRESILFSNSVLIRSVEQRDLFGEFNQPFANHRGIIFMNQWDSPPRQQQLTENVA